MTPGQYRSARRTVIGPYQYLDGPLPLAFAHRGGAAVGDENTANAFARAEAAGFRYLETDAHATKDGVAVLFHDDDLSRLTGDNSAIEDLTWDQLQDLRIGGAEPIPRLDEVLSLWPQMRFNIDVKSDESVIPTLAAIDNADAINRVLIASFSDARLSRVRRLSSPRLATSMGQREAATLWMGSRIGSGYLGFVHRAPAVQVPIRAKGLDVVDRRFVQYAHRLGIQVHVWTIDDPAIMTQLLDLDVDGIMTDQIDVLADVYRSRGHWPDLLTKAH